MRKVKSECALALRDFVHTCKNLHSLKSLRVKTENLLIYITISKLDSAIIGEWELRKHSSDIPTLVEFT